MRAIALFATVIAIVTIGYAGYLLFQSLIEPGIMAPALAASAAVSAVIAIVPYCIARLLWHIVDDAAHFRAQRED